MWAELRLLVFWGSVGEVGKDPGTSGSQFPGAGFVELPASRRRFGGDGGFATSCG